MNIAVDLDEVCCQFVEGFLSYYNVRHNCNVNISQIVRWEWWDVPAIKNIMPKDKWDKTFDEFCHMQMWHSLKAYEDAKYVLCALAEDGHNIYYVTDRPRSARRATLKFILKNGFPIDSVIFAGRKDKIAKALEVDIAIDDKPETVVNYNNVGIKGILMSRTHNSGFDVDLTRCNSLTEFYNIVKELAK